LRNPPYDIEADHETNLSIITCRSSIKVTNSEKLKEHEDMFIVFCLHEHTLSRIQMNWRRARRRMRNMADMPMAQAVCG